jgi:hypothetical protein
LAVRHVPLPAFSRTRRGPAIAVALIGSAAAVVVLALTAGRDPSRPPSTGPVRSATSFVDSLGVNVHMGYTDTAYRRADLVEQRLGELGVRHVRDGLPANAAGAEGLRRLGAAGIRADLIAGTLEQDPAAAIPVLEGLHDVVAAVEAPNEPDNVGVPDWPARTTTYVRGLRRALAARPGLARLPLLGPSLVHASDRPALPAAARDGTQINLHPYPSGRAPERPLAEALRSFDADPRRQRVYVTETGYDNALRSTAATQPPISEQAAAPYVVRLALESFRLGVRRTFFYELLDEKPEPAGLDDQLHFGLLREDFSPKPAFVALRRLIALASAAGHPRARAPGLVGVIGPAVHRLVLRRPDGSLLIAVWRPVSAWDPAQRRPLAVAPVAAQVQLAGTARTVTVTDPVPGGAPARRLRGVRRVGVSLGADALVLVVSG